MNNTKSSRLSHNSRKPEAMRVVLRSRNGSKDRPRPVTEATSLVLITQPKENNTEANRNQDINDIKDYVKNRMKTEYDPNCGQSQKIESHRDLKDSPIQNMDNIKNWSRSRSSLACYRNGEQSTEQLQTHEADWINRTESVKMQDLQYKTKKLLQSRLKQFSEHKIQRNATIQNEIQGLVSSIKKYKEQSPSEQTETNISHLDRKIKLFERFMAESMTESDIMKKHYLNKQCNQTRHKRLYTRLPVPNHQLSVLRKHYRKIPTPVILSSINRDTYVRPDSQAYDIYKYKNVFFNADRHKQPLPRSSYNREYLVYETGKEFAITPKNNQFMKGSNPDFRSSYKSDFKAKKAEHVNIKQLDSYRNKFRNLQMVFGRKQKKEMAYSQQYYRQGLNREKRREQRKAQPKMSMMSESRRQYQKMNYHIQSSIKHKHLHDLMYQYKSQINNT